MNGLKYTTIFLLPIFVLLTVFPQIPQRTPEIRMHESDTGIITGVELDGTICFLKIIPPDTARSITMPMHRPGQRYFYFGEGTLHYVLPDTVLRFVPEYRLLPPEKEE